MTRTNSNYVVFSLETFSVVIYSSICFQYFKTIVRFLYSLHVRNQVYPGTLFLVYLAKVKYLNSLV